MVTKVVQKSTEESDEWWSPEMIAILLAHVRTGNIAKLSEHPFSNSNCIRLWLARTGMTASKYGTGLAVYEIVRATILDNLDQARRKAKKVYHGPLDPKEHEGNLSATSSDLTPRVKELRWWSILACYVVEEMSIRELMNTFHYSRRQVFYQLKKAQGRFAITLLEREKSETCPISTLIKSKQQECLSIAQKESLLTFMEVTYSAPCTAFLWGDWSVLVSKKAIVLPLNLRVTVGIKYAKCALQCNIYEWSNYRECWMLNELYSTKMERVFSQSLEYLSSKFHLNLKPLEIYVFGEVPFGCGVHETNAMFLAFAGCLADVYNNGRFTTYQVEQLAAIIESFWYPQIAMADTVCSSRSPDMPSVLIFDRIDDGGIDFKRISENSFEELERNRAIDPSKFKVEWVNFDVSKFAVILHKLLVSDMDDVSRTRLFNMNNTLDSILFINFGHLCSVMEGGIIAQDYATVGGMMELHQALLSMCCFTPPRLDHLLRVLRSNPKIIGTKPSCSRPYGAIIALMDCALNEALETLPSWFNVLCPFVRPVSGLMKSS